MRDLTKLPGYRAELKKITDDYTKESEKLNERRKNKLISVSAFFDEHDAIQRRSTERLKALIKKYNDMYPDNEGE